MDFMPAPVEKPKTAAPPVFKFPVGRSEPQIEVEVEEKPEPAVKHPFVLPEEKDDDGDIELPDINIDESDDEDEEGQEGENEDENMEALAIRSRAASLSLQTASCKDRNAALSLIHKALLENADKIQQENKADIEAATKLAESGALSQQLVKRLGLSGSKFADMVQGVKDIEMMDDPVGKTTLATRLDDGLDLYKVSCPIGVVLIIFEARPEVVVNIAALALKSGNAVILKGGKEAAKSNAILTSIINDALSQSKTISKDAVLLVESRTAIDELLKLDRYIDLVIPRESNALVCHVQGSTRIPVLGHADGICATYLDEKLDPEMAIRVLIDAKKCMQQH
ncbi:hypothetical protein HDU80_002299 [Chytriomyces hyalinus]|nr:hypothetical protein HDU80_002299 [Chytriomyces hyalinus]